jgi:hypothetical protein
MLDKQPNYFKTFLQNISLYNLYRYISKYWILILSLISIFLLLCSWQNYSVNNGTGGIISNIWEELTQGRTNQDKKFFLENIDWLWSMLQGLSIIGIFFAWLQYREERVQQKHNEEEQKKITKEEFKNNHGPKLIIDGIQFYLSVEKMKAINSFPIVTIRKSIGRKSAESKTVEREVKNLELWKIKYYPINIEYKINNQIYNTYQSSKKIPYGLLRNIGKGQATDITVYIVNVRRTNEKERDNKKLIDLGEAVCEEKVDSLTTTQNIIISTGNRYVDHQEVDIKKEFAIAIHYKSNFYDLIPENYWRFFVAQIANFESGDILDFTVDDEKIEYKDITKVDVITSFQEITKSKDYIVKDFDGENYNIDKFEQGVNIKLNSDNTKQKREDSQKVS